VLSLSATKARRLVPWLATGCLVLHGAFALLLPERYTPISTLGIVLAQFAAISACLYTARHTGYPWRTLWWLLAFASALSAAGMTADFRAEVMGTTGMDVAPGLQVLLSTLNGVCFLLAVSMQFDPRTTLRAVRIINACLSLAMGATFYVLVFSVAAIHGANHAADPLFMSYLFDAMDVFIAIAATIRALGATETQERRFFCIISIFMWINTVFPAIHNHILIKHDFVWLDLFISAPYLLLVVLIAQIRSADLCFAKPSSRVARWVRSGSPIFLSLGLLLVGMLVFRTRLYIGATAILMAIVCYGALNVLTQSRGIEAEESLVAAKKHLESLVGVDSLTGIANRRAFDQVIDADCRAARRSALAISLLMIDVDFFKQFNDTYGHLAGDECLVQIAHALQGTLPRTNDLVARYGGEEFAVLLSTTGESGASAVARKLHDAVARLRLLHSTSPLGFVTISIGVSSCDRLIAPSPIRLTYMADLALYKAKASGRNRTEFLAIEGEAGGESRKLLLKKG
jgi:diguanylate cyclase (GGDEF)-like protein